MAGTVPIAPDGRYAPNPSYWLAALWRQMLAPTVLEIAPGSLPPAPSALQVTLHCSAQRPGTPIALALNLATERTFVLDLAAALGRPTASEDDEDEDGYLVHLLTSESLSSKVVRLNGLALVPAPDGSPPPFEALWVKGPVTLPPVSVAFVQPASAGGEEACA